MITRPCPTPGQPDHPGLPPLRDAPPAPDFAPRPRAAAAAACLSLVATLFLAACGGGGDPGTSTPPPPPPPPPAPNEVPVSAAADVASWDAYVLSLAPSDTTEPLQLDLITDVPTSDTDEPIAVP